MIDKWLIESDLQSILLEVIKATKTFKLACDSPKIWPESLSNKTKAVNVQVPWLIILLQISNRIRLSSPVIEISYF
jgi:hypothetical protein